MSLGQTGLIKLNADERTIKLLPQYPDKTLPDVNLMSARQIDAKVTVQTYSDPTCQDNIFAGVS